MQTQTNPNDLIVIETEERLETVQVAAETAYVSCAADAQAV